MYILNYHIRLIKMQRAVSTALFCMKNARIMTLSLQVSLLVIEICPSVISSAVIKGSCSMGLGLFCCWWMCCLFCRNFLLQSHVPVQRRTVPFDLICTSASELIGDFCRGLCSVCKLCLENFFSFLCHLFKDGILRSLLTMKYGQFCVHAEGSSFLSPWMKSEVHFCSAAVTTRKNCTLWRFRTVHVFLRSVAGKPCYPQLHFSLWYCM